MILPVIMAGGSGSRLWPLSRQQFPKQFLTLDGSDSMLQSTVQRLSGIEHLAPLVICNEVHRFTVAEQFRANNLENSGIILEPAGRNTAPAIALAALTALRNGTDPLLLVLAADHIIKDEKKFCSAVINAENLAENDKLVTFGIVPASPETGYGYIRRGEKKTTEEASFDPGYNVDEFVEKPDLVTAESYLNSGEYFWNSGMFLFKASRYIEVLSKYCPEIVTSCKRSIELAQTDDDFIRVDKDAFESCPSNSIDYAVMEPLCKESGPCNVMVIPMDCGWSDVGSWSSLWEVKDKDAYGNAFFGDVMYVNTNNSYVHASEKLVTVIGLDNVVVVETKDAVLVSAMPEVQEVKKIVEKLKSDERSQWQHHREVYRPWGKFDTIDTGGRFQVKRITVKPGAKLSVQMHHHRAEHWIIVSGTAKVTNSGEESLLTENQSTYIPVGAIHSLENPGKVPLEMIEVQSGSYLGEDDIVRFEDRYGRLNQ
ncbi:mannose-1-phosphate guanylyltransferase/mannose-6-phosphate isomerase [Alginatibacterium sediminis]|uniref:mannose-1-phosphate guanylyltransferase n=1 Tax=Alginatibacterium sediminis TaxID=2164068 RepID=A0A420EAU0_9ALTE|nr:mannose-1-phosphate guanylyltransferase/mannose-6-phosphate isomerase [Alginatibacterium sediminis]RKF17795.1 mannose-1-phosphate guanylyltransferase/mannose-6-phosphate isomerase [Alginatibacterium sediminis]